MQNDEEELLRSLKKKRNHYQCLVSKLENEIHTRRINESKISISDHAIIRYLERVGQVEKNEAIENIFLIVGRKSIVPDFKVVSNGFVFVIRERTVITIIDPDPPTNKHKRYITRKGKTPYSRKGRNKY